MTPVCSSNHSSSIPSSVSDSQIISFSFLSTFASKRVRGEVVSLLTLSINSLLPRPATSTKGGYLAGVQRGERWGKEELFHAWKWWMSTHLLSPYGHTDFHFTLFKAISIHSSLEVIVLVITKTGLYIWGKDFFFWSVNHLCNALKVWLHLEQMFSIRMHCSG